MFIRLPVPMIQNVAAMGSNPFADAYLSTQNGTVSGNNINFTDLTIGAADTRRQVLILAGHNGGTVKHTGFSGNAGATVFTELSGMGAAPDTANANYISAWICNVQTGTTITAPQLQCDAAPTRGWMAAFVHGRGQTVTDVIETFSASANSLGGVIDVPANGAVFTHSQTSTGSNSCAWTGVTENFDEIVSATTYKTGGFYTNTGGAETNRTITADWIVDPSANIRLIALAFGAPV